MFAHCHAIWKLDDFSLCFQHDYLQTLFPLVVCGISTLLLAIYSVKEIRKLDCYRSYTPLNNSYHVWDVRVPSTNEDGVDGFEVDSDHTDIDDEINRNAQLALHPSTSQVNRTTVVKAVEPRAKALLVLAELILVLCELAVSIAALTTRALGSKGDVAATSTVAVWGYVLALILLRLIVSRSPNIISSTLWYHTATIYGFQWVFAVLLLRSYIIHPRPEPAQSFMLAGFGISTVLFIIALASQKGDKAVELEYEGNIPPARESIASVFSLATFSWVDAIVWTGYQKTFELVDVWNIAPKDKAAAILADYRQVKKTSVLAWHLLKYFKHALLTQAAWAVCSGLLTFAPTLLLRAILQYIEKPENTPRNSAWFFVILLFASGCASALADGHALWVGRKTCIRLRAVIVGELYTKALKRKTGARSDKVLGDTKQVSVLQQTLWERFKALGRKKKLQKIEAENANQAVDPNSQVTAGTVINLMAVDSFKISEISAYLHFLWATTPVQAIVAIVLLYQVLGYSSIAGIGMMIVLLPINLYISKRFALVQKRILAATDARIHTTNEVLTNIRIIKYFAWEQRFLNTVNEKRKAELGYLRTRYILWSIAATIWGGAPVLITFLSFAFYTLVEKKALIPSIAFTALSLFQILRIPLDQLADMVAHVQEAKVSVDRCEEFLSEEDTQKYKQLKHRETDESDPIIGFDNATFTWGSNSVANNSLSDAFRIMDLDMRFNVGQLNVVAGPTGSGKTSLLLALLGEMNLLEGSVYLPGARSREDLARDSETGLSESVAYCAQQAWLVNDTVKENIVFASPWDPKRYKEVVSACALQKDFEILDKSDDTMVGEKGVTLSGGQKQRISLARALYCNARHVLLDDVLSAVDSHTARWIFDKALMGPLMYHRTCILVTHNVSMCMPHSQFVVLLDNGRVTAQGSAGEVINSGKLSEDLTQSTQTSRGPSRVHSVLTDIIERSNSEPYKLEGGIIDSIDGNTATDKHDTTIASPFRASQSPKATALQESKATGSVNINIILMYLKSMGAWYFWIPAAVIFTAQQLSSVSTNLWIREWANAYVSKEYGISASVPTLSVTYVRGISGSQACLTSGSHTWEFPILQHQSLNLSAIGLTQRLEVDASYYLGVYAILGIIFVTITFLREGIVFTGSLTASRKIHQKLMESVSHAKFRFFDSTPLGQIMNRFSKDIENLDQEIAPVAVGVVHCMASLITIVILISIITPGFLIAGLFISILYFLIGKFYINSSRDLKRLESVQRSPLYQQFGETLTGMTTIRAYNDERRFIRENLNRVNTHNRPFVYLWAANRWLAFRVDVVGALVSFFAGVFVVLSVGKIDAGAAGLAMTYAVTFTENVLWFVRLYATNEQNMNSVERIKEYLDIEQESPPYIPENKPPANWPSQGAVEFIGYTTRYRKDLEPVLRDVTFKIAPCEKVGIVGRTGAGKSSLALSLFRALEAEEGKILIDDVDIGLIGLQDLRESIVMVPQDPTLFTGTIRSNLDPFNLFTDEEVFTALRRVQLIGAAEATTFHPVTPPASAVASINRKPPTSLSDQDSSASSTAVASPPLTENKNPFYTLSSPISDSGSNVSQGQRQLLCLARALLKDPKVLLMDEATASIDYATDTKIQETIRELKGNTIITIAHRLKTIVDYDRIVVMDHGRVVEVGEPWELLKPSESKVDPESRGSIEASAGVSTGKRWFREMCEMSGELEVLEKEAKRSWQAKRLIDDS